MLHIHHSVTFSHTQPQGETPVARAIRLAGCEANANVAVLEVDSDEVSHGFPIIVDVQSQRALRLSPELEKRKE